MRPSEACFNPLPAHVSGEARSAALYWFNQLFQPTPRPSERGGSAASCEVALCAWFQPTPRLRERGGPAVPIYAGYSMLFNPLTGHVSGEARPSRRRTASPTCFNRLPAQDLVTVDDHRVSTHFPPTWSGRRQRPGESCLATRFKHTPRPRERGGASP